MVDRRHHESQGRFKRGLRGGRACRRELVFLWAPCSLFMCVRVRTDFREASFEFSNSHPQGLPLFVPSDCLAVVRLGWNREGHGITPSKGYGWGGAIGFPYAPPKA